MGYETFIAVSNSQKEEDGKRMGSEEDGVSPSIKVLTAKNWSVELPGMARSIRVQFAGARYHVINRGNYRKNLFSTHKTAEAFTKTLYETCARYEWWLHAYVIMSNHINSYRKTRQKRCKHYRKLTRILQY